MKGAIQVNQASQWAEPRNNIGKGSSTNLYEFHIWYRDWQGNLKCLIAHGLELQVLQGDRLLDKDTLLSITEHH